MCVLFVARAVHLDVPLIVASNRDEFHGRPTAPAAFWDDCPRVLAGRDLKAGGTWSGVTSGERTSDGRWAALTNIRAPQWMGSDAPRSRGALVGDYLCGDDTPADFAAEAVAEREAYGGFNLLVGTLGADGGSLWYASSRVTEPRSLGPGLYGLSNGALGDPWPKVARGGQAFQRWVEDDGLGEEDLFALMRDETRAPDDLLPQTGVGVEKERFLSPLFIVSPDYGTRATTLLTVRADGAARLVERSYRPDGTAAGTVAYDFRLA
jgi:uncharacterized protein with NRDE domain